MSITVGVLAIQGDIYENITAAKTALDQLGADGAVVPINTPSAISDTDAMIIPGGESTTMGRLTNMGDIMATLAERIRAGMPTLGICAGLILMSSDVSDRRLGKTDQPLLGVLDVKLERNAFGRQRDSFETRLSLEPLGIDEFPGVFIRAPVINKTGPGVSVAATLDNHAVAVTGKNMIGTAFHPELSGDASIHRYLVEMARR